jgi:transcriptional regulator with XRE-family HTH domain
MPGGPTGSVEVRASRLAERRRAHGLTQRELASRLGVTQNYIPALEGGSREPGPKLRVRLMEALDADFFDLFDVVLLGAAGAVVHLRPAAQRGSSGR